MLFKALSGAGLLVGVIVGAGMFAMPQAVAQAGIVWGGVHLFGAFSLLTLIHLLYGEIIFSTPGTHRLPGYARIYIGRWAGSLSLASACIGFFGALLAYGILGGTFLYELFGSEHVSQGMFTVAFFLVGGMALYINIARVGTINFILTAVLAVFIITLVGISLPHVDLRRIPFSDTSHWFLPYGIFLFAFGGASAIPEVADIFKKRNEHIFRRVLVLSTLMPLVLYGLFIISVVGITGTGTSPEAIFGLRSILGDTGVFIGSFIGLFAVLTSFLSLGLDLKNIFIYDYNVRHVLSWLFASLVPLVLYIFGATNFISAIGLAGAVAIGFDGITILWSSLRVCNSPEGCRIGSFSVGRVLPWILIIALLLGVVYEIVTLV